jgi:hypothetical protein
MHTVHEDGAAWQRRGWWWWSRARNSPHRHRRTRGVASSGRECYYMRKMFALVITVHLHYGRQVEQNKNSQLHSLLSRFLHIICAACNLLGRLALCSRQPTEPARLGLFALLLHLAFRRPCVRCDRAAQRVVTLLGFRSRLLRVSFERIVCLLASCFSV